MARTKKTTPTDDELKNGIKAGIIKDLGALGINTDPYALAIDLTTETLFERARAYEAYKENGSRQTTEDGKTNPYAVRLQAWNAQARACLSMLRLTPPYKKAEEPDDLEDTTEANE